MEQLEHQSVGSLVRRPARVARGARRTGLALRQDRRGANDRNARRSHLQCECAKLGCRTRLPSSAAQHRGRGLAERFLVAPNHRGIDNVLAAADLFFVVEVVQTTVTW